MQSNHTGKPARFILLLLIPTFCMVGGSEGQESQGENVEVECHISSGQLFMGGQLFLPPFKMNLKGPNVGVDGVYYERFPRVRDYKKEREHRINTKNYSEMDALLVVCDTMLQSQKRGDKKDSIQREAQRRLNSLLKEIRAEPIQLIYRPEENLVECQGNSPAVSRFVILENSSSPKIEMEVSGRTRLMEIAHFLNDGNVVIWGKGYLNFYDKSEGRILGEFAEEVVVGNKSKFVLENSELDGRIIIEGVRIPKEFVYDLLDVQ